MKILRYLPFNTKIIYQRFRIIKPFTFEIYAPVFMKRLFANIQKQ